MAKQKTIFICQECGSESPKWLGRCPDCGKWNTFVEEIQAEKPQAIPAGYRETRPEPIAKVTSIGAARHLTGIGEFDRLLGGGIVAGSATLIGGDPGIGKSTILLQVSSRLAEKGLKVLYATAEESAGQIRLRAERLGALPENLLVLAETNLNAILYQVEKIKPDFLVVDSVQMVFKEELHSAPGSVTQVRQCATDLVYFAKRTGTPLFLVGHVTKTGSIAGPRVVEHIVDAVLYFEGERFHTFRILRAVKNRFGPTNEVGLFEMTEEGLRGVENAAGLFLSAYDNKQGAVVVPAMEGTRPLLVEIQALTSPSRFASPQRRVSGVDYNRVSMVLAVLARRGALHLEKEDVFVNAVGGVRIVEPAADLGIAMAVASSYLEKPLASRSVFLAEIGLTGEVRPVSQVETRLKEAAKLGFESAVLSEQSLQRVRAPEGLPLKGIRNIGEALRMIR